MKAFGFLSFGHYGPNMGRPHFGAGESLREAVEIAVGAEEIGANGAFFRVHHFARQAAAPMPLLAAIAARTSRIEVGTGVIDMRYENPLYLAEEAAAVDLLSEGRIALGVSRGSPEPADRGWETFGYTGSTDPRGADIARDKFDLFMRGVRGEKLAPADPNQYGPGQQLAIEPHSPGLDERIWWGAGTHATAEWTARQGVNMMSSTLIAEASGQPLGELQAEQIEHFRRTWRETWGPDARAPRVSVSRSIFPLITEQDHRLFGRERSSSDHIGQIDGLIATFGKTYADTPDRLIEQLRNDAAVMSADTVLLTIPSQAGVDFNLHVLQAFAEHVAPELGWQPNTEGPVQAYSVDAQTAVES